MLAIRLENAISKLYQAFHNNTLNPDDCKHCAVGNILNQNDTWKHLTDKHGDTKLNYVGLVNQKFGKRFAGYTPLELLQIESVFLKACGYQFVNNRLNRPENVTDKDILFKGLEAVVGYLCQLENITHVMDCSVLFEYEPEKLQAKHNLVKI